MGSMTLQALQEGSFFEECVVLTVWQINDSGTIDGSVEDKDVCGSGICVVEFNATFNSQNSVPWIENLNDCETARVDIATAPEIELLYHWGIAVVAAPKCTPLCASFC